MTVLRLNKAHYPVTTLGPGIRAGIWVQGCTIACPGCIARDTWAADPRRAVPVSSVLDWLGALSGPVHGITISGGEPFQQPAALTMLLDGIDAWRAGRDPRPDILIYSGYPTSRLRRDHAELLGRSDAVITGPYLERRNTGARWRGSDNQEIVPLTPLGEQRYGEAAGDPASAAHIQVAVGADHVWFIGIPRAGDLERMAERLQAAGIRYAGSSWRP
jgi:anaerobic ribonucleoside-triphosphate reductase activating protein